MDSLFGKEIKQGKPFATEKEKVIANLQFTSSWIKENLHAYFKPFGITIKQYNILRILKGATSPLSTSEIRARMLDKMSDTTRLIDRMIKKNWVEKKISPLDKRLVDISITYEGEQLLSRIHNHTIPIYSFINSISEEQAKSLNEMLDQLRVQA